MSQAHTTTLNTMDGGVQIARRAWALRDTKSIVERQMRIQNVRSATVFIIKCADVGTTFDAFDDTMPRARLYNALFQMFMRGMEKTTWLLQSKDKAPSLTSVVYPVEMFLEAVLKRPANELPRSEPDYDELQKRAACDNLERDYGATRITAQHLMNGARSAAGSSAFGSASTDDIAFMNAYDDREVAEYRLWAFSHEEHVGPAEAMAKVFEKSRDFNTKHFGGGTEHELEHRRNGAPPARSVADVVSDDERWRLIKDEWHYIEALYQYTKDRRLKDNEYVKIITSPKVPLTDPTNEIYPGKVFSAFRHFEKAHESRVLDPVQTDLARYFNRRTNTWGFPRPSLVLHVPPERWTVKAMRCMYLPHYQKSCIEPRLDRGTELPPHQPAAAAHRESDDDDNDAIAAREARALELQRDADAAAAEQDDMDAIASGSDIVLSEDGPPPERPPREPEFGVPEEGGAMSDDETSDSLAEVVDEPEPPAPAPPLPAIAAGQVPDYDAAPVECSSFIADDLAPTSKMRDFLSAVDAMGGSNKTNLHTMRASYYHTMGWHINGLVDPTKRAFEYTAMQVRSVEEYMTKCTLPSSNVSKTGQIINAWVRSAHKSSFGYRFTRTERPYFDRDLSLFGVQIVKEYLSYENQLFMHTVHGELFVARMSAMTAYWYAYNQLRLNPLFIGPASTSKSYPLSWVRLLMIPGTTISLTNDSDLADTCDEDDNDNVYIYEEMPHHVLSNKTNKKQVQDQFKDMLTRGAVTRRVLSIQPDSSRFTRVVTSEKNCAYLMASNLFFSQIDPAVRSRTVLREHCRRERIDCTLQSKMSDANNKKHEPATKMEIQHFEHNFRVAQALQYHLDKMIMVGTLLEPSCIVLSLVYPRYKSILQNRFAITVARRVDEQIAVFVRQLVLHHNVYWLYHSPESPYYNAERISNWHLLALNPRLKDTEEIVYFALDQFKESFVNPNQQATIECLRVFYIPNYMAEKKNSREFFRVPGVAPGAKSAALAAKLGGAGASGSAARATVEAGTNGQAQFVHRPGVAQEIDYIIPDNGDGDIEPTPVPMTSDGREAQEGTSDARAGQHNYNYFTVKRSLNKLSQELQDVMRQNNMPRQLGVSDIKNLLLALSNCKIVSRNYRANSPGLTPVVVPDLLSEERSFPPIKVSADTNSVFIHSAILFGENTDPHEVAIRACMTSRTPLAKFISGLPVQEGLPHILNTRQVGPTDYTPLVDRLPSATIADTSSTSTASTGAREKAVLAISYDQYATRYRLAQLAMPVNTVMETKYLPDATERRARAHRSALAQSLIDYPKDLMQTSDKCRDHAKNVARELLHCGIGDVLAKKRKFEEEGRKELMFDIITDDLPDGDDAELVAQGRALQRESLAAPTNQLGHAEQVRQNMIREREEAANKMRRITAVGTTPATSTTTMPVVYTRSHNGAESATSATSAAPLPPVARHSLFNLPPVATRDVRPISISQPILNAESNGPGLTGADMIPTIGARERHTLIGEDTQQFAANEAATDANDDDDDNNNDAPAPSRRMYKDLVSW